MASRFARFSGFLARVDARADAAVRVVCMTRKELKRCMGYGVYVPAATAFPVNQHIWSSYDIRPQPSGSACIASCGVMPLAAQRRSCSVVQRLSTHA